MVERNVGQMSLADGLVQAPRSSILDEVEAVVDWAPLRFLLGKRGGDGAGNSSYPAEVLLRCLLAGIWHNLSDPALEAAVADQLSFRRFCWPEPARSDPGPQHVVAVSAGTRQGRADREDFR